MLRVKRAGKLLLKKPKRSLKWTPRCHQKTLVWELSPFQASISAGNLHSLSSDSILASVTSNQIPENAEIRKYVPVMNPTDSGVYQSENGGQGNFPSQAPENSVNPKDSLYVHSGHSAQSHKITPQPLLHPATGELIPIPIHIVDGPEDRTTSPRNSGRRTTCSLSFN